MGAGLPDTPDFTQRMYAMAAEGNVRAWLLYVGGEPAAYLYCPIHGDTAIYEFVGHDPRFNDLSVGAVLQVEALRDLFAEAGVRAVRLHRGRRPAQAPVRDRRGRLLRPVAAAADRRQPRGDRRVGRVRRDDGAGQGRRSSGSGCRTWPRKSAAPRRARCTSARKP